MLPQRVHAMAHLELPKTVPNQVSDGYRRILNCTIMVNTNRYASLSNGSEDAGVEVSIAGRVYAKRESSAKLVFYDLSAENSKVQILADFKRYKGAEGFEKMVETIKRGDIIGVTGTPTRTNKGELSVVPSTITLLSPCLHALPHAHQSITDQEIRYRKRYLDLIVGDIGRHILSYSLAYFSSELSARGKDMLFIVMILCARWVHSF